MRGISVWFVAARTKLGPERIQEIESDSAPLRRDGHGRVTARALAQAIGADPDEAAVRLSRRDPSRHSRPRPAWIERTLRVGRPLALAGVLALGVWLLGLWLEGAGSRDDSPRLVQRPDYLDRLLGGDDS